MLVQRNGFTYFFLSIIVMVLGLGTRFFSGYLPNLINLYLGDILWALMVFFLFGLLFGTKKTRYIATLTLLFSFGIEISQLYQSDLINALRQTRLGGLILGYGFSWSDLVSYSVGISLGVFVERFIIINLKKRSS